MCGIVGYIGKNDALPILLDGLKRLEYRGYDSSGIALHTGRDIFVVKALGKIEELEKCLNKKKHAESEVYKPRFLSNLPYRNFNILRHSEPRNEAKNPKVRGVPVSDGILQPLSLPQDDANSLAICRRPNSNMNLGIAHTRWATHGAPSEINAHPHTDCAGKIWLVHNGIIENYNELKTVLIEKGHTFKSETDSEVIAHLIEDLYEGNLLESVHKALGLLKGTYGLAIIHQDEPENLIAAKMGSPLLLGLNENEIIIASDASAVLRYTKQVVYLEDGELAEINNGKFNIYNLHKQSVDKKIQELEWDIHQAEKQGFSHFMLKEIFEQGESIKNSIRGRLVIEEGKAKLGGLESVISRIRKVENLVIIGCGTSYNAGMVGKYMMEEYAGIPTEIAYASEFRYRKPILKDTTAIVAISQSGETADTLAAIKEAKEKNILTLGIVNVVGSSIARLTDAGVYNHIGPEVAVASTKAFCSQVTILALMTILLGRQRDMSLATGKRIAEELEMLSEKIGKILEQDDEIYKIAKKYQDAKNFAFLGRKYNWPVAPEGALKLKELSYIHAEGFPSGELKHGPIAMIDENFPCFFIAPCDSVYEKNLSNMKEIKARHGKIIAVTTEENAEIKEVADDWIFIPKTLEMLTPILSIIPLQIFAYHMAVLNGRDVDQPRNLAKSVTVE